MRNGLASLLLVLGGCGDNSPSGGGKEDLAMQMQGGGDMAMMQQGGGDMAMMQGGGDMAMMQGGGDMAMMQQMGFTTVFTVVLENTSYNQVVGNMKDAPFINSLIAQGGLATNYKDSGTHPSLPNYLYMTSGDPQYPGIVDCDPTQLCDFTVQFPIDKENLGHQLTAAGVKWRAYMDSMMTPCKLTTSGPYAPKHNPFVYFTDIQKNQNLCNEVDVDYTKNFDADLAGGTYRYMWITPDLNHDGHDTNLATADAWCAQEIPKILNSATYKAGGVLFLTWDEGTNNADQVVMVVVSPKIKMAGMKSPTAHTHASFLATVEDVFGLPRLGAAQQANTLSEFFQ